MYDICNNEVFTMETTYSYLHRVQYYETDGMRIVHHANYIHWMEEARIAYMEEAGYTLCGTATSDHCFIGKNGRPVSLKKYLPKVFDLYSKLVWKPETL